MSMTRSPDKKKGRHRISKEEKLELYERAAAKLLLLEQQRSRSRFRRRIKESSEEVHCIASSSSHPSPKNAVVG